MRFESVAGAETSSGGQTCEAGSESDPAYEPRNRRACDRGSAEACGRLGVLLSRSEITAKEARALLNKGCDGQNYPACGNLLQSCLNLGVSLLNGDGGPKDLKGSQEGLDKACKGSYEDACALAEKLRAARSKGAQRAAPDTASVRARYDS